MEIQNILKEADVSFFLFLNGHHNAFADFIMYWASDKLIWLPFYLFLLLVLIRHYGIKKTLFLLLTSVVLITLSDQLSTHLFKNVFQRLRPCHNENIAGMIHLIRGCGGKFGFVSSHAANVFALASFLLFVTNIRWFPVVLLPWAILVSYSRIYAGVHYPGDVAGGILLGIILGKMLAWSFLWFEKKQNGTGNQYKRFVQK